VWVGADPAPAAADAPNAQETAAAERQRAWQELARFGPPELKPLLEALEAAWQDGDLPMPEQAFELEGPRGDVLAQVELAWPEKLLAVVSDPVDAEAFKAAGWRCWSLEDPPGPTAAALREALRPS
jgi:hypothetical protein